MSLRIGKPYNLYEMLRKADSGDKAAMFDVVCAIDIDGLDADDPDGDIPSAMPYDTCRRRPYAMMEKDVTYFRIRGQQIGKREDGRDYLLNDGEWISDEEHVISDHLMGYDPYEPEDSPYAIGNTDIMAEMDTITADEALPIIERQILVAQHGKRNSAK